MEISKNLSYEEHIFMSRKQYSKDQTFPYRMILKVTFFEPEKIDSVILYPIEK